jgi:hypothetical protein
MRFPIFFPAMAGALLLFACGDQDQLTRERIAEAAKTGWQAAEAVGKYAQKRGRYPQQIEEAYIRLSKLPDIKLMSVDGRTGVVRLRLSFPPVEEKSLLFVPMRKGRSISWRCTSEDIRREHLPDDCRQ